MHKEDLALNNQQRLICYKAQPTIIYVHMYVCMYVCTVLEIMKAYPTNSNISFQI